MMKMDKHRLTRTILVAAFMGASSVQVVVPPDFVYAANQVVANNTLPSGAVHGNDVQINQSGNIMNITQENVNSVIKWNDFSIGANATVNFDKNGDGVFNSLNYVNGGNLSQIYGTINADNGNIFIVNPAGVEIGNSAQINVGSLYVSNNLNNQALKDTFGEANITGLPKTTVSNGELMSLGNINATNVTFDGDRIVLDTERVKNGSEKLNADKITIKTIDEAWKNNDIVLGYDAYENGTYDGKNTDDKLANIEGVTDKTKLTKKDGYMWVKDGLQLQAMDTNEDGNYAFRNSIDLNSTAQTTFDAVGSEGNEFKGTVDGLGFDVYGLNIRKNPEGTNNVGLFGATDGATIRNFNLISGTVTGDSNVGAVVGNATNTTIENVTNTLAVTGDKNVGGIVGSGTNVILNNVKNTGAISGDENAVIDEDKGEHQNVGGLAGSLSGSTLKGESYNLGNVEGQSNVGGLVGEAKENTTIGNALTDKEGNPIKNEDDSSPFQIYNHLDVTGGYNVGGIVGSMTNSTVQNVANDGNVTANGYTTEEYKYHTGAGENTSVAGITDSKYDSSTKIGSSTVQVANVGGIAGNSSDNSTISDAVNEGNISSAINYLDKNGDKTAEENIYYSAGNVGGVVGRAEDTNITNATNKEANIRGAHNVGGIAGYFGNTDNSEKAPEYTIKNSMNNGGDILATGARNNNVFVQERVRPGRGDIGSSEIFNIGNMGGIAGYMYGDKTHIDGSSNRGTVHSAEIETPASVKETSKAANVGGVVGKIDRSETKNLAIVKDDVTQAAVSNSYNTGNVRGYTGVGGVVGMMYNGEVAGSYNLGTIQTTRQIISTEKIPAVNMGGIIGDTTENSGAKAVIYDVYLLC